MNDTRGLSVLVVDDEPAVADLTASHLERVHDEMTVVVETAVETALRRVEREPGVDCIVSDYDMPRMDGLEFLAAVRDIDAELPFILFTGKGSEEIASEAITAGVTDYLQKGMGTEQYERLTNSIENAVAKRRAERDLRHAEARYRRLVEQNLVGIYIVQNGRIEYANPKLADILGYDRDELTGMSPLSLLAEESDRAAETLAGHEQGELGEAQYTLTGRRKDGTTVDVEVHGGRIEYGGESAVIGVCKDVDDRRQREHTLRALHDTTNDLVRARTDEAVAERAVEAAKDVLGFSLATVRLYDAGRLQPIATTDATTTLLGERPPYGRGEALPWRAFESSEPILAGGSVGADGANDLPLESSMYVPIGEHGTFSIGSESAEFADEDVRLAQMLAANAATALDRLEREAQLRRYEQMLDAAGDAIYLLDVDGTVRYGNAAAEALTGYDVEELVGEHVSTVQGPEDTAKGREIVMELVAAASADDSTETTDRAFENTVQTADGAGVPCESRLSLLKTDGEIEGVVGVARDITERKRRERMVETLHDATRRMMRATTPEAVADIAVETIERVLGMAVNGVWLYDEGALRPTAISERGRELFETPPTYTGGDSLSWAAFERGETRNYDRVDHEDGVHNTDTRVKSEIIVPLGEYGVLNIGSMEPGAFDEGDVSLANLLAANTETALDRAERECLLHERERELERQNQQLEEFASVVSHDLRNPLGLARGRLELANEDSPTEHHEDIRWALSRMDSLVEDLLALARQGTVVDETERVSLASVAESAWRTAGTETASLVVENPGELDADADRLARLFENLFRNATEHAGDDTDVTVGALDSAAGFYVADDGPGISPAEREHVFDHGYSTVEAGTGLGLTIVRSIAEAHGWEITVTESDAGGARFEVRV